MYKFTKEEKKSIRDTMTAIVEELRYIYDATQLTRLSIRCPRIAGMSDDEFYDVEWNLVINDSNIHLENNYSCGGADIVFEKTTLFGNRKVVIDYDRDYRFIIVYDRVLKELEEKAKKSAIEKSEFFSKMQEFRKNHESIVEINMPQTMNRHEIKITHEDGRTVGTIDFGRQTIKIITSSDIVLVDDEGKIIANAPASDNKKPKIKTSF